MKKEIKAVYPSNCGWLEYKLNTQEMDYMWRCISTKKENYNSRLAGNISSSYALMDRGDWFWMNVIVPLLEYYEEEFGSMGAKIPTTIAHPLYLKQWWVNYQKQNEFNPLHDHSGVYSFVIWMKIPFSWDEQNKKDIARRSNNASISTFQFIFNDILGETKPYHYHISSEDEGTMLFFPSKLNHIVYHFYDCDEDRISVSGNVSLNTAKAM